MHQLPLLSYAYDALEPYIDARTMELHHQKHHQTYVDKLNTALEKHPELFEKPLEELLKNLEAVPPDIRTSIRNHGGGHYNHSLFWRTMGPDKGGDPGGPLAEAVNQNFGDFAKFKELFSQTAANIFGSGWAWLAADSAGKLQIISTFNQDNPLTQGLKPLLGLDVWEHGYYLKYQNRRPEYIAAWWNVINWEAVEKNG